MTEDRALSSVNPLIEIPSFHHSLRGQKYITSIGYLELYLRTDDLVASRGP